MMVNSISELSGVQHVVHVPQTETAVSNSWAAEFRETMPTLPVDHYSNFNADQITISGMSLDVEKLDFENQVMHARVSYDFSKTEGEEIIFDVDGLEIEEITVDGLRVDFEERKTAEYKPNALSIHVGEEINKGTVSIAYKTSPDASGLFWIDACFTDGKKHPIFFTQAEPTDGASWLPGPHSPQVRMTYKLSVNVGSPEMMLVASAKNNPERPHSDGIYSDLQMDIPIPLYLLGIAVGEFSYHPYDERCGVYAETCKLPEIADKFKMLPDFMSKAEEICGPYGWEVYRPLFLPLSYPYGAMEHACASFMGGTVIERPEVLAHELSHSWAGNWITNATWMELFLNEGLTSYIENKIMAVCLGEERAKLLLKRRYDQSLCAIQTLKAKGRLDSASLVVPFEEKTLKLSSIPYAKGALFFYMLENAIGTENLNNFLKKYMEVFARESMGVDRMIAFLQRWLAEEMEIFDFDGFKKEHHIDEWLHGTGYPPNTPKIESRILDQIKEVSERLLSGEDISESIRGYDLLLKATFLTTITGKTTAEQLRMLDSSLGFTQTESNVLKGLWILCCAKSNYLTAETKALIKEHLIERNSVTMAGDVCESLVETDEGKALVEEILADGKERLFPMIRKAIERLLVPTSD